MRSNREHHVAKRSATHQTIKTGKVLHHNYQNYAHGDSFQMHNYMNKNKPHPNIWLGTIIRNDWGRFDKYNYQPGRCQIAKELLEERLAFSFCLLDNCLQKADNILHDKTILTWYIPQEGDHQGGFGKTVFSLPARKKWIQQIWNLFRKSSCLAWKKLPSSNTDAFNWW